MNSLSDLNGINLDINSNRNYTKCTNSWKLSTIINDNWFKAEIKKKTLQIAGIE